MRKDSHGKGSAPIDANMLQSQYKILLILPSRASLILPLAVQVSMATVQLDDNLITDCTTDTTLNT